MEDTLLRMKNYLAGNGSPDWQPEPKNRDAELPAGLELTTREARILDDPTAKRMDKGPASWYEPMAVPKADRVPGSGSGYLQQPYTDSYNLVWGIQPIADLTTYQEIERNDPWVQSAVQTQINLALNKGYTWRVPADAPRAKDMLADIEDIFLAVKHDLDQHILSKVGHDMLVFGNSFMEQILNGDADEGTEDWDIPHVTPGMVSFASVKPEKLTEDDKKNGKKAKLVNLKVLSPINMRVRQNSLGDVQGYVQWPNVPPVAFYPSKIVHFRWQPRTVAYEQAYGTSDLLAYIRTNAMIKAIENDLYIGVHKAVKGPVIWSSRDGQPPMTDTQVAQLRAANEGRNADSDIFSYEFACTFQQENSETLKAALTRLEQLRQDRVVALHVPMDLLGLPSAGTSRANESVNWDVMVVRLHGIQRSISNYLLEQCLIPILELRGWSYPDIMDNKPYMDWEDLAVSDINLRSARAIKEFNSYALTRNELREELGRARIENGDIFLDDLQVGLDTASMEGGGNAGGGATQKDKPSAKLGPMAKSRGDQRNKEENASRQ